jgi:alkylation response protein AidB-like acyl-CoA dehydrogenase
MRTTAIRDGDEYVLNGGKRYHERGRANLYRASRRPTPTPGHSGISAFLVESDAPGFAVAPRAEAGDLRLHDRRADVRRLPHPGCEPARRVEEGFKIAMRILDRSRPGVAAQALGIAQGTDYALEYAKSRETMGKPIAEHQLIAAKLADMETMCEAARGLSYRFGQMCDDGADDAD